MQPLDLQVVSTAVQWLEEGRTIWLCTVLSTFGSSPREPGSLMVARQDGAHVGSLSGGCVEEDFLERLSAGEYASPAMVLRYGDSEGSTRNPRVRLPCGGILEVLVERLGADDESLRHCNQLRETMETGQKTLVRTVRLSDGSRWLGEDEPNGPRVEVRRAEETVRLRVGPVAKLILAGYSTVAESCARFAVSLGYQVVVCDPRNEVMDVVQLPEGVLFEPILPSLYIAAEGSCSDSTAIVATTHDPKIDDLAMMAAVKTTAGYIGVMGSERTSRARAERLARTGGLRPDEIERIRMPIGLQLGSKTPAEIALAIMADLVRVRRGRTKLEL